MKLSDKLAKILINCVIDQFVLCFHPSVTNVNINLDTREIDALTMDGDIYHVYPGKQMLLESGKH